MKIYVHAEKVERYLKRQYTDDMLLDAPGFSLLYIDLYLHHLLEMEL